MDYLKHYFKLIEKSRQRNLNDMLFYEKHHIIPKSIFNDTNVQKILNIYKIKNVKEKINIVYLLPEEHFVAHLLLVKICYFINTNSFYRMLFAVTFMKNRVKNNKEYKWLRTQFRNMMSIVRKGKPSGMAGKKWSKERKLLGNVLKGKTYEEMYGKEKAKELKEKRSLFMKGKTLEEKLGFEKSHKMINDLKNRIFTDDWKKKISDSKKGKKPSKESIEKIKKFFSNDKLNPHVHQDLYEFENIYTGEKIISRKYDMKKKYNCNCIHKVIDGRYFQNNGWKLLRKM